MSKIIGDSACPECRSRGRDSTGNHLIHFEDGNKKCNRCGYFESNSTNKKVHDIDNKKDNNKKDNKYADYSFVSELPVVADKYRKYNEDTAKHFSIHTAYDESTGSESIKYYPLTRDGKKVGYKVRKLPKSFSTIGNVAGEIDLFGQSVCPQSGRRILVCGGEEDTIAAYYMFKKKYPHINPAVVGFPKGENKTAVLDNLSFLRNFDEIVLCPDMDDTGRDVAEELAQAIGPQALIMSLPEKDISDMLKGGRVKEFYNSYWNAKEWKPKSIVEVMDVFEEATKMPEYGRSWPWPSLTKLTYGRRDGEGIFVGAGVKQGKSEFVNETIKHIITVDKLKPAVFKLEEKPSMTVRRIAGKMKGEQYHKPDGDFTQQELRDAVNEIDGTMFLGNNYGSVTWDELKSDIRYAVAKGSKDIFIDPITRLTVGLSAADTDTELRRFSDELASMAKDLGFFYMVFCHLKAPTSGVPHERGGKVHSNQFRGSRAMMEACYYMLGIERNRDPELSEEERNTSRFVLLEDRAFGNSGYFDVFYNTHTGSYLEPEDGGEF